MAVHQSHSTNLPSIHKSIENLVTPTNSILMERRLLNPNFAAFQPEWEREDILLTFFKCTRWQVEETLDPITCPFHYFCDSIYTGNYPPAVDAVVLFFTTALFLATLVIMVIDISRRGQCCFGQWKRFLLPSGPVSLPLILLALAKGQQINTLFPLSCIGPATLQLVQISALAFDFGADKDPKYALFEASTISGILHASLYLDSVILPYYTGFDALVSSDFSGECLSCVCRNEALVAGGKLVSYRGWSLTTFSVAGALCLRIICRTSAEQKRKFSVVKSLLEGLGWMLITKDCIYLVINSPPEKPLLRAAASGGILVLICLQLLKKVCRKIVQ